MKHGNYKFMHVIAWICKNVLCSDKNKIQFFKNIFLYSTAIHILTFLWSGLFSVGRISYPVQTWLTFWHACNVPQAILTFLQPIFMLRTIFGLLLVSILILIFTWVGFSTFHPTHCTPPTYSPLSMQAQN